MKPFKPSGTTISKRKAMGSNKCRRGRGESRALGHWWLEFRMCSCCGQRSAAPQRVEQNHPAIPSHDPAIPLPGKSPKEWKMGTPTRTCTPVFTAASFKGAQRWEHYKCPSTDEWINKMGVYIHTMKNCSDFKKNETMITCYYLSQPRKHHVNWNKSKWQILCDCTFMRHQKRWIYRDRKYNEGV